MGEFLRLLRSHHQSESKDRRIENMNDRNRRQNIPRGSESGGWDKRGRVPQQTPHPREQIGRIPAETPKPPKPTNQGK
jgi:hypothetical protein